MTDSTTALRGSRTGNQAKRNCEFLPNFTQTKTQTLTSSASVTKCKCNERFSLVVIMSAFQYLATPAPQVEPPEAAPVVSPADDTEANKMRAVQPARPSEAAIADAAQEVEPAIVLDAAPRLAFEKTKTNKEVHPLSVEALRANGGTDFESKVCLDSSQRPCLIGDHDSFSYLHEPPPPPGRGHQGKGGSQFLSVTPVVGIPATRFRVVW